MRLWRAAATAAAVTCLVILGTSAPALAKGVASAPSPKVATSVSYSLAPSCVYVSQWDSGGYSYARATNYCSYTVRVRMIWRWALDGSCVSLYPSYRYTEWRYGYAPYVESLERC